jgi:hypothetical protein
LNFSSRFEEGSSTFLRNRVTTAWCRNSKQGGQKVVIFVKFFLKENKFQIADYCNGLTNLPILSGFPVQGNKKHLARH